MDLVDELWSMDLVEESQEKVKQRRKETREEAKERKFKYREARRQREEVERKVYKEEQLRIVQELMNENDKKFREFAKDGNYMKLHWHMEEENKPQEGWVSLYCGYNPRLWDLGVYGQPLGKPPNTLQVYKIKLTSNVYPLEVYGQMRLISEYNSPQLIFSTDRIHSQTITEKDPYLLLTGPFCPPFFYSPGLLYAIEARLILKGTNQSDDKYLGLNHGVGVDYDNNRLCPDDVSDCCEKAKSWDTGKNYLLELTHGIVIYSVAATISVELDPSSSRQDQELKGYYFTAYIGGDKEHGMEEVVLLDSRDGKGAAELDEDNKFKLSRKTICVEKNECLMVHVEHDEIRQELKFFHAGEDGEEVKTVHISSCTIKVEVKWSKYDELCQRWENMFRGTVQQEGAAGKLGSCST